MEITNNITITHPEIAQEWDYEKNNGLLPIEVSKGQTKTVYWLCPKGHSYTARIDHRCSMRSGCPYCSHKKVLPGETDIATVYPELAAEWDYENNELPPSEYMPFSNKTVSWICPICHKSYKRRIEDRTVKRLGCPNCTKPGERSTSQQEQSFVFYYSKVTEVQSRAKFFGKEIDVYLPELNAGIEYDGEYFHQKRAEKDIEKKKILTDNGVRLIIVKCGRERAVTTDTVVMKTKEKYNPSFDELAWAIKESFSLLSLNAPEIDLKRDVSKIYALYIRSIKENNISTKFPDIAAEWNYGLNEGLTPEMFAYAANKKAWWTCKACGNDYDMVINNRTIGKMNCPYCAGKRIKVGFNDLATTHPQLAEEWDYDKNEKTPQEYSKGSDKKVWWLCKAYSHSYCSAISSRANGTGCPVCTCRVVMAGFNDIETLRPDVALLWNNRKNIDTPRVFTISSNKKVWWECPECGYEWKAAICDISQGRNCPECAKKNRPLGRNETFLKRKGSFADNYPELLIEWDYDKNSISPEKYLAGSEKKVWWICRECGNSYEMTVYQRTGMQQGCPKCGKEKCVESAQENRLLQRGSLIDTCPKILDEWDYDKNESGPEAYTKGSKKKVWWKCSKGHSWQAVIHTRTKGVGCPKCAGRLRCMNVDIGEIYDSYTEAAKSVGVTRKAITFAIKNGTRCKGFMWKAIE